ncbi:unnamed protein product [Mycena citricolor]|uniref:Uncharacterized protein n=1 Tax=Mycena citricolor TaxID=2018698 RepID=A0AAD2Q5P4_9AGAR|nr:unnamed protein product [Mycena citricolor]
MHARVLLVCDIQFGERPPVLHPRPVRTEAPLDERQEAQFRLCRRRHRFPGDGRRRDGEVPPRLGPAVARRRWGCCGCGCGWARRSLHMHGPGPRSTRDLEDVRRVQGEGRDLLVRGEGHGPGPLFRHRAGDGDWSGFADVVFGCCVGCERDARNGRRARDAGTGEGHGARRRGLAARRGWRGRASER